MNSDIAGYEHLRCELEMLPQPIGNSDRRTLWVVDRVLGIAKTAAGTIELFLIGEKIYPSTSLVKRHLEYGRWQIAEEFLLIDASRIVLPAEPHFLPLAALIGTEFVRCGLHSAQTLPRAFARVEPLIELALQRTALAEEHILGLVGELLCLEVMLDSISDRPELRSSVLDMWRGHTGGLRDFVIGDVSIEVKTTQLQSSSHKFSGLHQVEASEVGGSCEQGLFLLSIGLAVADVEGQSLSELVQRIINKLSQASANVESSLSPLQQRFLADVSTYGTESSFGYDHMSMAGEKMYNVLFRATFFPRLYDLLDSAVRIIRKQDLVGTHVSPNDLQFRLDLESTITPLNPVLNWIHAITELVRSQFKRTDYS